jgi:SAM-dependent methyltransferase
MSTPDEAVRSYFNSGVIAHGIAAAFEIGLLRLLEDRSPVPVSQCRADWPNAAAFDGLIELLARAGIITVVDECLGRGPLFEATLGLQGFFGWLYTGSGRVLVDAGKIIVNREVTQRSPRDGSLIARASADFGSRHLDDLVSQIPELQEARAVADLGCGSGARIAHLTSGNHKRAIGIDADDGSVALVRSQMSTLGLDARISIMQRDVRALEYEDAFAEVDALTCFLMGHDLWPRDQCILSLQQFRTAFPAAKHLIFGETVRSPFGDPTTSGVPALGYEYLHAVMGQYIPTLDEWYAVLAEGGWPSVRVIEISVPAYTHVFVCERD